MVTSRLGICQGKIKLDATDALAVASAHLFLQKGTVLHSPRKSTSQKSKQLRELIVKMGGKLPE